MLTLVPGTKPSDRDTREFLRLSAPAHPAYKPQSFPPVAVPFDPATTPPFGFSSAAAFLLLKVWCHRDELFFFALTVSGRICHSSASSKETPVISPSLMEPENLLGSGFQPAPGAMSRSVHRCAPSRDVCPTPAALIHLSVSPKITQKTPPVCC